MTVFIAFIMHPMGDIDQIHTYKTEAEADEFALDYTSYHELDPVMDKPDHWEKYDPAMVLLFEADDWNDAQSGKFTRPVAIYERGEKLPVARPSIPPRR